MDTGTWCFPGLCWEFTAYSQIHMDKDGTAEPALYSWYYHSADREAERSRQQAAAVLVPIISDFSPVGHYQTSKSDLTKISIRVFPCFHLKLKGLNCIRTFEVLVTKYNVWLVSINVSTDRM